MTPKLSSACVFAATLVLFHVPAVAALRFTPQIVSGQVGVSLNTQLTVSGGVGPYTVIQASLGYGVSISSGAMLSGTPISATARPYAIVTVQVTDTGAANTTEVSLGLNIAAAPVIITTASLPKGTVGSGFVSSAALAASGGVAPYTFSLSAGSLDGLTLNADGSFSGAFAAAAQVGFSAQVTDSVGSVYVQAYSFQVYSVLQVTTPTALTYGLAGNVYGTVTAKASGGSGTYAWTATGLPTGMSINVSSGAIGGTPQSAGVSSVVVTVRDATAGQVASSGLLPLRIYGVLSVTGPASLVAGIAGIAYPNTPSTANGGSGIGYNWTATGLPGGMSIHPSTGLIGGTPTATGTSSVTVTATDAASGQSASSTPLALQVYSQITLTGPAQLPAGVFGRNYAGATFTVTGGSAKVQWSLTGNGYGLSINGSGQVSGTVNGNVGATSLTVSVTDTLSGQTVSRSFALQIYSAPQITGPSQLPNGVTGKAYAGATMQTFGGSGSFSWSGTGFPGLIGIDLNGNISGSVGGAPTGSYPVTLTLLDRTTAITLSQSYSIQIFAVLSVTGPSSLPSGTYNAAYPATKVSTSGGSGSFVWSATGLPSGMAIDLTGTIVGTPTSGGTFSVTVTLIDLASNQSSQQTYPLSILFTTLSIAGQTNLGTIPVNTPAVGSFSVSGGGGPYAWQLSGAPAGLAISNSGVISGTPGVPSNYWFSVNVTDAEPTPVTTSVSVNLGVVGLTTTSTLPAATTVATYSTTFLAAGGLGPYQFSAGPGLPGGVVLSNGGVLAGQPKTPGIYSFSVTVRDAGGVQSASAYSLTVAAPTAVKIQTSSNLSDGNVNIPYAFGFSAGNGNPGYSWTVSGGALPDGLSLSSGGTLSGTPTKQGSFSFSATVQDASGGAATGSFGLRILPTALSITNTSLPSGIALADYPQQIVAAVGGVAPYTFAITAGTLPTGLTLTNGAIGGTPATATTTPATFTITVTDYAGMTAAADFSSVIRSSVNDLILSTSAVNFALLSGATQVPDSQKVTVKTSSTSLAYSVSGGLPNWLSVDTGSGVTPSNLTFALTAQALGLTSSPAPVPVTICQAQNCNTTGQTITVSLTLTVAPPKLGVGTDRLSFSSTSGTPQVTSQSIQLRNDGGGSIAVTAIVCNATWCSVGNTSGTLNSGSPLAVAVYADPTALTAGYYRTTVDISTSAGTSSVPVTLLLASAGTAFLAPSGSQFVMTTGGAPGSVAGSFLVSASGQTAVHWTAAVQPQSEGAWLNLSSASGIAMPNAASVVAFSINAAVAASLSAKAYYGTIRVVSGDAVNSPVDYQVILNVLPVNTPSNPDPQPAGLIFLTTAGTSPPPQLVKVFAGSSAAAAANYSASASVPPGPQWLTVTPAMDVTSASAPGGSTVTVNSGSLAPGIYSGGVTYSLAGAGVRTVNVTLIVQPQLPAPNAQTQSPATELRHQTNAGGTCTPTALAPTQTGLVNNFAAPTSWPTPLAIRLYNDCGSTVVNGQVTVTFSNGDPPLAMPVVDNSTALYSATWTPRSTASQVTVTAQAIAPGYKLASAQITGSVTPNKAPILAHNGTLHIFNPQIGGALAPGNVVQIYGNNLAGSNATPSMLPLPVDVNGTRVIIGGIEAPLFFVGAGQIDAQVPYELDAGKQYQVIVSANGALTAPDTIALSPVAPGLATFADGTIIAQHGDGSLVTVAAPAIPGEYLVLYSSGMGQTDNPVVTGAGSPTSPLARPMVAVSVTVDGTPATVAFAGLTPGLVGLYQVNFQVPTTAKDGTLQLVVTQNGMASNPTVLPVHK